MWPLGVIQSWRVHSIMSPCLRIIQWRRNPPHEFKRFNGPFRVPDYFKHHVDAVKIEGRMK